MMLERASRLSVHVARPAREVDPDRLVAGPLQREAEWMRDKRDQLGMLALEAQVTSFSGSLQKAREVYRRAMELAQR